MNDRAMQLRESLRTPPLSDKEFRSAEARLYEWGTIMRSPNGHIYGWSTSTIEYRLMKGIAIADGYGAPGRLTLPEDGAERMDKEHRIITALVKGFTESAQKVAIARYVLGIKKFTEVERITGVNRQTASDFRDDIVRSIARWFVA